MQAVAARTSTARTRSVTIMKVLRETLSATTAPSGAATAIAMNRTAWKMPTAAAPPWP